MPTRIATAAARSWWCTTAHCRKLSEPEKRLSEEGHTFTYETDTEIIAHLVEKHLYKTRNGRRPSLEEAARRSVKELSGGVLGTETPLDKTSWSGGATLTARFYSRQNVPIVPRTCLKAILKMAQALGGAAISSERSWRS
jgi:hypothetical protein